MRPSVVASLDIELHMPSCRKHPALMEQRVRKFVSDARRNGLTRIKVSHVSLGTFTLTAKAPLPTP